MPETIQDVIASRIDRLPEDHKHVIQTAAVIGREFAGRLLRRIADIQAQLDDCLSELKNLEFIYEKSVFPDLEYMFKHVLTQEAAYNSLLSTRRTRLHTAIGLAMEELYQERLAERYEELAHHFTQGEAWEKAFHYLEKSGEKARQAYANQEAIAFYTQAIDVNERLTLPRRRPSSCRCTKGEVSCGCSWRKTMRRLPIFSRCARWLNSPAISKKREKVCVIWPMPIG